MAGHQLHVRARLGDGHAQLIEAVARREDGEGTAERDLAARCQARRHADHVRLGNADGEEALGEFAAELDGGRREAEVGVDADDVEPLAAETGQRRAEGGASGFSASGLDHASPPF